MKNNPKKEVAEEWTKTAAKELHYSNMIDCHPRCERTGFLSFKHHPDCLYRQSLSTWINKWLIPEGVSPIKENKKNISKRAIKKKRNKTRKVEKK